MEKEILVSDEGGELRLAVREDGALVEYYEEGAEAQRVAGNIYKGRVENVLPGMQAAFVNIGLEKNAYLYVDDAHPAAELEAEEDLSRELPEALAPRPPLAGRQPIDRLLRPGQEIVVQVSKEPVGTKGARVTRHLTIPGRFLVLLPGVDYVAVSHRIASEEERERLRGLARRVKPNGAGLIVRTAAEGRAEDELAQDARALEGLWAQIRQRVRRLPAPALVHQDQDLLFRVLRDGLSPDVTRVIVDSPELEAKVRELVAVFAPELAGRVHRFDAGKDGRRASLFDAFGVDDDLQRALARRVWLPSGAYIVIDHTEALTCVDVNTGRFVGSTKLAETVLATNLEAAREIARQLRLRDVGGIIVIDFIDMTVLEHRQKVLDTLQEWLRRDRAKAAVLGITHLGLVEVTRQKRRQSLPDLLTRTCPYCGGSGRLMTEMSASRRSRREIRRLLRGIASEAVLVEAHPSVAALLIGPGGSNLKELEQETGKSVFIRGSEECHPEELRLVAIGSREEVQALALPVHTGQVLELKVEERHMANTGDGIARVEGYVIDIEGAANRVGQKVKVEITKAFRTYAKAKIV